jgi:hypothetical protein
MFALEVDPFWYEKYWLRESPRRHRRFLARQAARLALAFALLAGSGVVLDQFHAGHAMSDYPDWEQE